MVEGLCRGLLRDRVEAEDASQQTFLSAYRALLGGGSPREPGAWLAAIARNECVTRIRERMRAPLAVEVEPASGLPDPLAEAIRRADLAALWRAVSELPRQQRDALLLREFGGLSYDELAVALGVSAPAVESLLFRARTRLRGQLRTALATVNGAGWLSALQDALGRLLASGGAAKLGGAPLAAKAVGATLGAAVLAGGAVIGEQHVLRHRAGVPARPAAGLARPSPPPVAAAAPAVTAPVRAARVEEDRRPRGRDGGGDRRRRSSAPAPAIAFDGGGEGGGGTGPAADGGHHGGSDDGESAAAASGSAGEAPTPAAPDGGTQAGAAEAGAETSGSGSGEPSDSPGSGASTESGSSGDSLSSGDASSGSDGSGSTDSGGSSSDGGSSGGSDTSGSGGDSGTSGGDVSSSDG